MLAKQFAIDAHGEQMYGEYPYSYHLNKVVLIVRKYTDTEELINAAWLHDVLEDTDVTYFDLTRIFGVPTANVVWGCTGTGNNRKARQASIKAKLGVFPGTALVKLADRMGNMQENLDTQNRDKFYMYMREHQDFGPAIAHLVPKEMYREYLNIIQTGLELFNVDCPETWWSSVDRFYQK